MPYSLRSKNLEAMISAQSFVVLSMSLTVKTTWPSFFTLTGVVSGAEAIASGHCSLIVAASNICASLLEVNLEERVRNPRRFFLIRGRLSRPFGDWGNAVLEYRKWNIGTLGSNPTLHYSILPLFHYFSLYSVA